MLKTQTKPVPADLGKARNESTSQTLLVRYVRFLWRIDPYRAGVVMGINLLGSENRFVPCTENTSVPDF
jgi:hypothetical protein